jgi:hypothetical protein
MYVDDVASMGSTPASEYELLEGDLLASVFGTHPVEFRRDVPPHRLRDHPCDVYVIDFGGLAALTGNPRGDTVCRNLVHAVAETPATYFLVWSSFSARYFKGELFEALACEVGEAAAEDLSLSDVRVPPNVILWPEDGTGDEGFEKLRGYLGLPAPAYEDPLDRLARRNKAYRYGDEDGDDGGDE